MVQILWRLLLIILIAIFVYKEVRYDKGNGKKNDKGASL